MPVKKYRKALRAFNKEVERRLSVSVDKPLKEVKKLLAECREMRSDCLLRLKSLSNEYTKCNEVNEVISQVERLLKDTEENITGLLGVESRLLALKNESDFAVKKEKKRFCRERSVAAEIMLGFYLHYEMGIKKGSLETDKKIFDTPYGKRRSDGYYSPLLISLESKLGYCCLTKRVKIEILKDSYLLSRGVINRCIWVLWSGGSKPLISELAKRNIEVHIGWSEHERSRIEDLGYLPFEYFA